MLLFRGVVELRGGPEGERDEEDQVRPREQLYLVVDDWLYFSECAVEAIWLNS